MNKFLNLCILGIITLGSGCAHRPVGILIPEVAPISVDLHEPRVVLVLGGGGSKGVAHIGVLEVLEKHNIPIDLIVGCSAGSAIGAMYADNPDALALRDKVLHLKKWDLMDLSLFNTLSGMVSPIGPVSGNKMQQFLLDNIEARDFKDLKIPFVAVATDIETSEAIALRSGPIAPAVNASAAVPPFFSPVDLYDRKLVDGGVIQPVPVEVAKLFNPKLIISVDISAPPPKGRVNNMVDLTYRSGHISYYELTRRQSKDADIDIHPDLNGFGMFDDDRNEEIYKAGKTAAEAKIPEIKRKLEALDTNPHRPLFQALQRLNFL